MTRRMFRPAHCRIARHAFAGADRVSVAWGWTLAIGAVGSGHDGSRLHPAQPHDAGRAYKADGSIVPMRGAGYTVQASKIKALSKECRAWFRATAANVRASDARIARATTPRTMAELSPVIAAREKAFRQWATGGRKAAGASAPYNPAGATACCPDYGRDAWRYFTVRDAENPRFDNAMPRVIACGCITRHPVGHECAAESADRAA